VEIAVIGTGMVGSSLGRVWAGLGHNVVFGSRDPQGERVQELVRSIGAPASATTIRKAAAAAEVVALATPWHATQEAIQAAGDLTGKVLIDCTNPLRSDYHGLEVGLTTSAGEQVAAWAPGARVVKAFNAVHAPHYANPRFGNQVATLFICGDDDEAKDLVTGLGTAMGFEVVDTGPLWAARLIEPLAGLWVHLAFNRGFPRQSAFKLLQR